MPQPWKRHDNDPAPERESPGAMVFSLCERQERIADRLNKKIARLEARLAEIEERGRE